MIGFRRWLCALMILALCMNFMPGAVFADEAEPTEETTIPTEAPTEPTEAATEPTEATSEPTEATSEPTEAAAELTDETVIPTDTATEPTDAVAEPTEEMTIPTEVPTEPTEAATEPTEETTSTPDPVQPASWEPKGWGLYFGQLHAHSTISDGTAPVESLYTQAAEAGLDFFAVTDHGESISGAEAASITQDMTETSTDWAAGKAAAAAAASRDFVGLYGFEMSWPGEKRLCHVTTLGTPGFASWQQPAFSEALIGLESYGAELGAVPGGVSQFCHPGPQHGDFSGFTQYSPAVDNVVQLLEVGSGRTPYRYYDLALDHGWHVAPTCNQTNHYDAWEDFSVGRTVILADSLTEEGLYSAIRNHRVYATRDCDLQVYFDQMGSRLARRNVGRELTLTARICDPTDPVGRVEVIVNDGEAIAAETVEGNAAALSFAVPDDYSYYYLRITQPDGDTAVTAPLWLEGEEEVGIASFSCETNLPIQGKPLDLSLKLQNGDHADLLIEKIDFSIDGEVFHTTREIPMVPAGEEVTHTFSPTLYRLGLTEITVTVTATLDGEARCYEKRLSVSFRRDDMLSDILVDAAHGNAGTEGLKNLELLAADNRVRLILAEEIIQAEQLAKTGILLVTAPETAFSEDFVQAAGEFARYGGTLILCGRSSALDEAVSASEQLNRILAAAGAAMTLRADTALDDVHNGGKPDQLYPVAINTGEAWCENVNENQIYRHISGCSVAGGTWLVKGHDTAYTSDAQQVPVLLAWEKLPSGGNVFAAGSLWLLEEELAPPKNIWDEPFANRTILEAILGITPPEIPLLDIQALRAGAEGAVCRIRGYVTAGTAREGNRFPDTIYLQDDTGGIAVTPFTEENISVGTPMEITGYLETVGKNKQFHMISCLVLDAAAYRFTGLTGPYGEVMNNALHGGELIQIEGFAERIELTQEGILSQIILRDEKDNYATVLVEPYILSGSTGKNELALDIRAGQEIRAYGILHMHTDGTAVLRVRNCDEVIVIDPWPYTPDRVYKIRDKTNPQSGDSIDLWLALMVVSGGLLLLQRRRRKSL